MPNVKAGFDAWAPNLQGLSREEIRRAIHKLKPYIALTIAADYVRLPRFRYETALTNYRQEQALMRAVPMGQGVIDYETFFRGLEEIGYQGYVAYELCEVLEGGGSVENLDKAAQQFLAYMKNYRGLSRG
jgi:sugar phosphate isomerase/epimerase